MEDLTHREREIVERVIADTGDVVDMVERLRAFSDAWLRAVANGREQPGASSRTRASGWSRPTASALAPSACSSAGTSRQVRGSWLPCAVSSTSRRRPRGPRSSWTGTDPRMLGSLA